MGILPPIIVRPYMQINPQFTSANTATNAPLILRDKRFTLFWKNVPGAAYYKINITRVRTYFLPSSSSPHTRMLQAWTSTIMDDPSLNEKISPTRCSCPLDFKSRSVRFLSNCVYDFTIFCFDSKDRVISQSRSYNFQPANAIMPPTLNIAGARSIAPVGVTVEKTEIRSNEFIITGKCPGEKLWEKIDAFTKADPFGLPYKSSSIQPTSNSSIKSYQIVFYKPS